MHGCWSNAVTVGLHSSWAFTSFLARPMNYYPWEEESRFHTPWPGVQVEGRLFTGHVARLSIVCCLSQASFCSSDPSSILLGVHILLCALCWAAVGTWRPRLGPCHGLPSVGCILESDAVNSAPVRGQEFKCR